MPRSRRLGRKLSACLAAAVLVGATAALAACAPHAASGGGAGTIALLLPETKTARYETFDRPYFEARIAELGDFQVLYANADQDAAKQQQQAESALASGAQVIVLDPVDAKAAASIVAEATAQDVPVVSYDRLIAGGDLAYYVSFDNEKIGELQATALVDALEAAGTPNGGILMVNGSPTDSNAVSFEHGAQAVIARSGLRVLASYDTPDWSPDKAQEWVAGQIAQFGDQISGIYAANDGTAGGAISALKAAAVDPLPVVTGQDAELAALQRIVNGDQYMTIYKGIKPEAELAAEVAVTLLHGGTVTAPMKVDGTPTTLLHAVVVTVDNIVSTVVADGVWTIDDICTPDYAAACAAAGIV